MTRATVEDCQRISVQNIKEKLSCGIGLNINGITVSLVSSKCNYGGCRYWFVCPKCNWRVGVLYRKPLNQLFLCRKCNNLTYQKTKYRRSKLEPLIASFKRKTHTFLTYLS